jgi:hypothetical protein
MGQVIRDWWPIIAFWTAAIGWFCREMFMYFKRQYDAHDALEKRVTSAEFRHASHEDICSRRYGEIAIEFADIKERTAERHEENVQRFEKQDAMLVELLTRSNMRRETRHDEGDRR